MKPGLVFVASGGATRAGSWLFWCLVWSLSLGSAAFDIAVNGGPDAPVVAEHGVPLRVARVWVPREEAHVYAPQVAPGDATDPVPRPTQDVRNHRVRCSGVSCWPCALTNQKTLKHASKQTHPFPRPGGQKSYTALSNFWSWSSAGLCMAGTNKPRLKRSRY